MLQNHIEGVFVRQNDNTMAAQMSVRGVFLTKNNIMLNKIDIREFVSTLELTLTDVDHTKIHGFCIGKPERRAVRSW